MTNVLHCQRRLVVTVTHNEPLLKLVWLFYPLWTSREWERLGHTPTILVPSASGSTDAE